MLFVSDDALLEMARLLRKVEARVKSEQHGEVFNAMTAMAQRIRASTPRVSKSLARLWRDQGKVQQARELLAPVYGWFTEGHDTRDLREAKALLEELAT
jgi:predicted ATPase